MLQGALMTFRPEDKAAFKELMVAAEAGVALAAKRLMQEVLAAAAPSIPACSNQALRLYRQLALAASAWRAKVADLHLDAAEATGEAVEGASPPESVITT